MYYLLLFVFLLMMPPMPAMAQSVGEVTNRPLPRFASMRGDMVYARTGPGTRYPIEWVYKRKHLPIEIVREFDTWRKIRDVDGQEGWVHQSLISGKRFALVIAPHAVPILKERHDESRAIALVETGAQITLDSCEQNWCALSAYGLSGWIQSEFLWGVYEGERFE